MTSAPREPKTDLRALIFLGVTIAILVVAACATLSPNQYEADGGALTSYPLPVGWILTVDADDNAAVGALLQRAFPEIENALPTAIEVGSVAIAQEDRAGEIGWSPSGRATMMPPQSHGPGISSVNLLVGRFLRTGEPLAEIRFGVDNRVERPGQTPFPEPSGPHYYHLDIEVFRTVIAMYLTPERETSD